MTALCVRISGDHALIAADTLITARDGVWGHRSKVLAFPHLKLLMVSCGSGEITDEFVRFLQRNFYLHERSPLSGPECLRDAYREHFDPFTGASMPTRVILAQADGKEIRAAHFGSPHFTPELLPTPTYLGIPAVEYEDWNCPFSEPADLARFIGRQKERHRHTAIGNQVTVARLDVDGTITMFPQIDLTSIAEEPEESKAAHSGSPATVQATPSTGGRVPPLAPRSVEGKAA